MSRIRSAGKPRLILNFEICHRQICRDGNVTANRKRGDVKVLELRYTSFQKPPSLEKASVLFDISHTLDSLCSESGAGDHGVQCIRTFLDQHHCVQKCAQMGLKALRRGGGVGGAGKGLETTRAGRAAPRSRKWACILAASAKSKGDESQIRG
ncbi:hypothetical protein C8R45DRAFT_941620 [Mycena sanguinolenta]|nr:hypothetical protein C8R45DRAFT_941620 [Mycena sanguinolenta]